VWAWLGEQAGCGCRTGAVKCLSGAATPTGLIALSPCPVLIGFGTRDNMHRTGGQRVQWPAQGDATRPDRLRPWLQDGLEASSLVEAGLTGSGFEESAKGFEFGDAS
jgi:hypothetical protein